MKQNVNGHCQIEEKGVQYKTQADRNIPFFLISQVGSVRGKIVDRSVHPTRSVHNNIHIDVYVMFSALSQK